MNRAQRRKQNCENAQKSTGPKTEEGKDASRRNALKHGFTSKVVFPDEDAQALQDQADAWSEALMPETHDEDVLAQQVAIYSLKLQRLERAEEEVVMEQVREADTRWVHGREGRVLDLTRRLQTDPAHAVLELKSFAAGVGFLLKRWRSLKETFEARGCWNNLELIREALRLLGHEPDGLKLEPMTAYELALLAVSCIAGHEGKRELASYLESQMPPEWVGRYLGLKYTVEEAQAKLRARVDEQVARLAAHHERMSGLARESRAAAGTRALALEDTPGNRLLVRYKRSTESSFERTLKMLAKLQADREKADAAEADAGCEQAVSPDEAKGRRKPSPTPDTVKTYIDISGTVYEARDWTNGSLTLLRYRGKTEPGSVVVAEVANPAV